MFLRHKSKDGQYFDHDLHDYVIVKIMVEVLKHVIVVVG